MKTANGSTPAAVLTALLLAGCGPSNFRVACEAKGGVYLYIKGEGPYCFRKEAFLEMTNHQPGGWK